MPYNNNIPQPTDLLSTSQPQLLTNFASIQTAFSVNHIPIDDGSGDQGKHRFVNMPVQVGTPATALTEGTLYTRNSAATGRLECWFVRGSGGDVPFTEGQSIANGWSRLPSGIILKWGSVVGGPGNVNITYNTQQPFTSVFQMLISKQTNTPGVRTAGDFQIISFGLTTAVVNGDGAGGICRYLVIGV